MTKTKKSNKKKLAIGGFLQDNKQGILGGLEAAVGVGAMFVPGMQALGSGLITGGIGNISSQVSNDVLTKQQLQQQQLLAQQQQLTNIQNNTATKVFANGGEITEFNGNKHEEGGIPLGQNIEVEDGESRGIGSTKDYVFSDKLKTDNKKTFSDEAKKIDKKYKSYDNDRFALESKNLELANLMAKQEGIKMDMFKKDMAEMAAKYPKEMQELSQQTAQQSVTPQGQQMQPNQQMQGNQPSPEEMMQQQQMAQQPQMRFGGRMKYDNGGTLSDFYTSQGMNMPSLTERKLIAEQNGILNYTGTADQNTLLRSKLEGNFSKGRTIAIDGSTLSMNNPQYTEYTGQNATGQNVGDFTGGFPMNQSVSKEYRNLNQQELPTLNSLPSKGVVTNSKAVVPPVNITTPIPDKGEYKNIIGMDGNVTDHKFNKNYMYSSYKDKDGKIKTSTTKLVDDSKSSKDYKLDNDRASVIADLEAQKNTKQSTIIKTEEGENVEIISFKNANGDTMLMGKNITKGDSKYYDLSKFESRKITSDIFGYSPKDLRSNENKENFFNNVKIDKQGSSGENNYIKDNNDNAIKNNNIPLNQNFTPITKSKMMLGGRIKAYAGINLENTLIPNDPPLGSVGSNNQTTSLWNVPLQTSLPSGAGKGQYPSEFYNDKGGVDYDKLNAWQNYAKSTGLISTPNTWDITTNTAYNKSFDNKGWPNARTTYLNGSGEATNTIPASTVGGTVGATTWNNQNDVYTNTANQGIGTTTANQGIGTTTANQGIGTTTGTTTTLDKSGINGSLAAGVAAGVTSQVDSRIGLPLHSGKADVVGIGLSMLPNIVQGIGSGILGKRLNYRETTANTYNPTLQDPTMAMQNINTQYAGLKNVAKNNTTGGGNYMANMIGITGTQAGDLATTANTYDSANATIQNTAKEYNATVKNAANDLNAQIKMQEKQDKTGLYQNALSSVASGLNTGFTNYFTDKRSKEELAAAGGENFFYKYTGPSWNQKMVKVFQGNGYNYYTDDAGSMKYLDPDTNKPIEKTEAEKLAKENSFTATPIGSDANSGLTSEQLAQVKATSGKAYKDANGNWVDVITGKALTTKEKTDLGI